jgi:hypothetical protein
MAFPDADQFILGAVEIEISKHVVCVVDHRSQEFVLATSHRLRYGARARSRRRLQLGSHCIPAVSVRKNSAKVRINNGTSSREGVLEAAACDSRAHGMAGTPRLVLISSAERVEHGWRRLLSFVVVLAGVMAAARGMAFATLREHLLPQLLAQPRVPEVLDLVVRPPGKPRCDLRPAARNDESPQVNTYSKYQKQ